MAVDTVPGAFSGPMAGPSGPGAAASAAIKRSIKKRYAAERRFRAYGIAAILFGLAFLAVLFASIVSTGYTAFVQSSLELNVFLDRSVIDPNGEREPNALMTADYTLLAKKALATAVGADPANKMQMREVGALLSRDVDVEIRKVVLADPAVIGKTVPVWVLASGRVDSLLKGTLDRNLPAATRKISDQQLEWIDKLVASGALAKKFNTGLFTNGASSNPETAGIGVAMVGSLFMMVTVLLLAVPLGVAAAVYLQEFAPKNFWTDLIEVNINNLAAVPVDRLRPARSRHLHQLRRPAAFRFHRRRPGADADDAADHHHRHARRHRRRSTFDPRSGPWRRRLEDADHYASCRAAGDAWHPDGDDYRPRQGAGRDGTLLMIGMVAFVVEYRRRRRWTIHGASRADLLWATSAERGFVERTAGATIILLAVLICMNLVAVILRRKYERRW